MNRLTFSVYLHFMNRSNKLLLIFLAILEMSKSGIVNIKQTKQFDDIDIIRGVNYSIG